MNVFADRLFAALLGWTRSLFNGVWNLVTNDSAGISGFLQRFWLPLILILLVFGTVCDYVIWLIRWRPYFVWRTWFRNQDSLRKLNITRHYMEDLDHAPLDLPEYQEVQYAVDPAQAGDEPLFYNFAPLPQPSDAEVSQDDPKLWASIPPAEYEAVQPAVPEYEEAPFQPQEYEYYPEPQPYQEGFADEEMAYLSYAAQEELIGQDLYNQPEPRLPEGDQQAGTSSRRRRTSRRRQSNILRSLRDMLFTGGDNNETFDSLPAAVEQDNAFHKPYYPQNYIYKPNPGQPEQNNDRTPQ